MARLMCVANGNNTSASTWALIDSTSFVESESSSFTVPTSYSTGNTQFTPGAITIDGIGLRLSNRTGTTGTFSVDLYNHTAAGSVAGTEVTINCSDFVDATTALADGGWIFFKFGSPVTLLAANNYSVRVKTSDATQILCFGSSTTNPSRILRTTTTQAPVAGDDRFVMGEWTAAATTTTRTVTLDDTSTVDYGSAASSVITPALSISAGGIVLAGTTASTTYVQKISGTVVVYSGGILRLATSGSRMPSTSSFTWTFDCVSNVDFGIDVRKKGEFSAYGETKQRWTTLTADKVATNTVIALTSTSGWKNSDTVLFPATGTVTSQAETKTISTVDSSTQITLSAGLTNPHTGSGDLAGEAANLTANISILGISTTVGTYINFRDSSLGILDNIALQYYGSNTTNKRGVDIGHITGAVNSVTLNSCVFRDQAVTQAIIGVTSNTNATLFTITNNVVYNATVGGTGITINGGFITGGGTFNVSNNLTVQFSTGYIINAPTSATGTITGNRTSGCTNGITYSGAPAQGYVIEISGFVVHSCSQGMTSTSAIRKTLTSCDFISTNNAIISCTGENTFVSCNFIGNTNSAIAATTSGTASTYLNRFNSCVLRGRTGFAQAAGVAISANDSFIPVLEFNNCSFGQTTAHTNADISVAGYYNGRVTLNNCTLASTTEISSTAYANLLDSGMIAFQRKDTTAGNHVMYIQSAIVTPDTTIYKTATPSIRVTPKSTTVAACTKLFPFKAYVNSGQTCTPTVFVRESEVGDGAAYNGNRVKLYVKANYNLGITSDTLLDTATASSDGAWEGLTGTTSSVTDDGVLEFYLTCDGSTGWINIDDFSFVNA